MIRGETQYNRVSRFVREIPRELVDLGHTIQEKKPKVEELIPTPAKYSKMKEILQGRNYKPREFKVTKPIRWIMRWEIRFAILNLALEL